LARFVSDQRILTRYSSFRTPGAHTSSDKGAARADSRRLNAPMPRAALIASRSARSFLTLESWPVLVLLLIVGLAFRVAGIAWGLPQVLHPDEFVIVDGAIDMAARRSFEPAMYFRPDHVEIQLSYIAYAVYSKVFLQTSIIAGYAAQPETYLLISRLITMMFGLAIIVLMWFIGRKVSARVGFFAAAIATVLSLFVDHSHYATPDVPLTTAFLGVVLAMCHYIRSPRIPSLLIASACISISIAIKYPGAIATLVIAIVVIYAGIRDRTVSRILGHGMLAMIAVVVFLFQISPVLFTNYHAVIESFEKESGGHPGADGLGPIGNFLFYGELMGSTFGIILGLFILLGIVDAVQRRRSVTIPWVLGGITWVILSAFAVHWDRWSVPMYITPVLFAALGLARAGQMVAAWNLRRSIKYMVVTVLSGVMLVNLVLPSIALDVELSVPDSRIAAQDEFAELGITLENSIYEGYTPLDPSAVQFSFNGFTHTPGEEPVPVESGKDWLVLSSCSYTRFADPAQYPVEHQFYVDVRENFPLVFSVDASDSYDERRAVPEPVNIANAVTDIIGFTSGAQQPSCDLRVYDLTP
jgi:hypothetical protein